MSGSSSGQQQIIPADRKYPKLPKAASGYLEIDFFKNSDLHTGYFCYNCIYWINQGGGKCMLVENEGPDVLGKVSDVIAPHGCCAGYEPNYNKLHDTRSPQEGLSVDSEKNKEKITTADIV